MVNFAHIFPAFCTLGVSDLALNIFPGLLLAVVKSVDGAKSFKPRCMTWNCKLVNGKVVSMPHPEVDGLKKMNKEHVEKIHALQAYIKKGTEMCQETVHNLRVDLEAKEKEINELTGQVKRLMKMLMGPIG